MLTIPDWPDEDEGRRLHAALIANPNADDFAEAFYAPLCAYLTRTYRDASEDVLVSVASNLILGLIKRPEQYDPEKLPVCAFLRMAARRKLSTATSSEARCWRAKSLNFVAEQPGAENVCVREDDAPSWDDPRLAAEIASFAPVERAAFELMRSGVRSTATFARTLGLDVERPDIARVVKRLKDLIMARLRRALGGRP